MFVQALSDEDAAALADAKTAAKDPIDAVACQVGLEQKRLGKNAWAQRPPAEMAGSAQRRPCSRVTRAARRCAAGRPGLGAGRRHGVRRRDEGAPFFLKNYIRIRTMKVTAPLVFITPTRYSNARRRGAERQPLR